MFLYLAQLYPDINPTLFKVGFTTDLENRIRCYKTTAPHVKFISTRSGNKFEENKCLNHFKNNAKKYGREVFLCDDVEIAKTLFKE